MKSSCILVPVKGVAGEEEVLRLAFTLAGPPGDRRSKQRTQIEVIHVIEVPQALALDAEMPDAIQAGEQALARAEQLAAQREITIEAEMLQARSAGIAIVDEAIERGADLIIMGAVYRSQHGEFNLGGTLPYVFKNAPCRVLVMRSPKPEGEEKRGKG